MKTVIEVWHTDRDGWKANHFATKTLDYDEKGKSLGFESWRIEDNLLSVHSQDDITVFRKLLDEIEKDLNEVND